MRGRPVREACGSNRSGLAMAVGRAGEDIFERHELDRISVSGFDATIMLIVGELVSQFGTSL